MTLGGSAYATWVLADSISCCRDFGSSTRQVGPRHLSGSPLVRNVQTDSFPRIVKNSASPPCRAGATLTRDSALRTSMRKNQHAKAPTGDGVGGNRGLAGPVPKENDRSYQDRGHGNQLHLQVERKRPRLPDQRLSKDVSEPDEHHQGDGQRGAGRSLGRSAP
jgi:hypothetical protein